MTTPASAGGFLKQNGMVVVAFIISLSVLVAALIGRGRRRE